MRTALRELIQNQNTQKYPEHAGLAYDVYAPLDNKTQKLDEKARDPWFKHLEHIPIPIGYNEALERWAHSFEAPGQSASKCCFRSKSRLLIGHGNAAPTEVGLSLHKTWGTPMIPGSSIKGLLAHYIETTYGPDGNEREHEIEERKPFQGLRWKGKRVVGEAGAFYAWLFGSPEVDNAKNSAQRGHLVMYDALWMPGKDTRYLPLKRDILTVHQKSYYNSRPPKSFPNDYDDPNPVAFLSVHPGARFLFTWSLSEPCPYGSADDIRKRVERYLREALLDWGIGGKTSSGYGRMEPSSEALPTLKRLPSPAVAEFERWLLGRKQAKIENRALLEEVKGQWWARLKPLPAEDKKPVRQLLSKHIASPKLKDELDALLKDF